MAPANLSIRPPVESDAPRLAVIHIAAWRAGQLYAINLHPEWWAKGIGTVLFAAAEETLVSLGYQAGFLWVEAGNERAVSFYTKRGWLDDGGIMEDARFDPPVVERRHSRSWKGGLH